MDHSSFVIVNSSVGCVQQQWLHDHDTALRHLACHFLLIVPVNGLGAVNALTVRTGDYFQRTIIFIGIIEMDPDREIVFQ